MAVTFTLNGKPTTLDVDPNMPLLWAIREVAGLTGTKFGCGMALCGACTVHIEGQATRSCVTPVSAIAGQNVVTIEGLSSKAARAVQAAWRKLDVVQCGYCQSGQIMSATALLARTPQTQRQRHQQRHERQHLPLRHLCPHPRRHPRGGPQHGGLSQ